MCISYPFHCFLFYFRFAEISKHKLPDNNTNATSYHINSLVCTGTEDSVEDCSFSWALRTCSDKSAIHVSCSKCVNLNVDHIIFCLMLFVLFSCRILYLTDRFDTKRLINILLSPCIMSSCISA
jgi:hypothetical protein